ncbi:hypothetical protein CQA66_08335 [Helicobacter aurati]|uniref:site-specific DNA-methyltransferase (cytosine-N(4)-specific) n=1 Tax=Helicobacter aurati TaxID=137778 RepID=A0A3D8IZJ0_9HELI|nr:site-specific DNA-methyltransferase [Helicobacter aurati]RDU70406.1 hypothetical protein CQA66_08335 [Helicobacter aurati]
MICSGDIIKLGRHTIICADSTDIQTYKKLLQDTKVDLVLTSPPYNAGILAPKLLAKSKILDNGLYLNKYQDNLTKQDYYNFCINTLNNISHFVKKNIRYFGMFHTIKNQETIMVI